MLAHKVALEIIPTADIDIVLLDANEIETLTLANELTGARQRKDVLSHPDQRSELIGNKPTLLGQLSPQGIGSGLSGRNAAARGNPEMLRAAVVPEGLEE